MWTYPLTMHKFGPITNILFHLSISLQIFIVIIYCYFILYFLIFMFLDTTNIHPSCRRNLNRLPRRDHSQFRDRLWQLRVCRDWKWKRNCLCQYYWRVQPHHRVSWQFCRIFIYLYICYLLYFHHLFNMFWGK
jgi:hypothetical protein